jgi:hypothetical protein
MALIGDLEIEAMRVFWEFIVMLSFPRTFLDFPSPSKLANYAIGENNYVAVI